MFRPSHVFASSSMTSSKTPRLQHCLSKHNNNVLHRTPLNRRSFSTGTECDLTSKKCVPCEGGVDPLPLNAAKNLLQKLHNDWKIVDNGKKIQRVWKVRNFVSGINFFEQIKDIAEDEGHHPDLHLVNYRDVTIDLWTHAIGGLSENDFIIAAKIDQLKPELKK